MKKYEQDLLLALGTIIATVYTVLGRKLENLFFETGNIYIPLLGRWLLPLIWGIFWGISICLLSRLKLKITPVSLLLLVVNGGIIWYLWKTSYEISSCHLMMLGGTLAAVLVLALQRLRQKEKQK